MCEGDVCFCAQVWKEKAITVEPIASDEASEDHGVTEDEARLLPSEEREKRHQQQG